MNLPEEIIREEIFMRLPIKSLVRFRSVCKLWYSITFDLNFCQSYSTTCVSKNPIFEDYLIVNTHITQRTFPDDPHYNISILARTNLSESRINKFPYSRFSKYVHLVGSINGLVCVVCVSELDYRFILWNPVIGRYKKYFQPERLKKNLIHPYYLFGFGWDSLANDYKFLVCYMMDDTFQSVIYSCKDDKWSEKILESDLAIFKSETCCTIVKGCPYWICSYNCKILQFKVESNKFRFLPDFNGCRRFILANLNDCLARLEFSRHGAHPVNVYWFDENLDVWSTMYTIDIGVNNISLCFKYGGEIVFDGKKNVYDHKSNEVKCLGDNGGDFVNGFSYIPSFVYLKGMKQLHGRGPRRSIHAF